MKYYDTFTLNVLVLRYTTTINNCCNVNFIAGFSTGKISIWGRDEHLLEEQIHGGRKHGKQKNSVTVQDPSK